MARSAAAGWPPPSRRHVIRRRPGWRDRRPVAYSQFGGNLIAASTLGTVQRNGPPRVVATPQRADQLAVATYNVENLAPGDPDAKFQRLAEGVVTNLASPDVVAVEEVQDDDGATDDGVVAAGQTLTKLTAAIAAAGGPRYDWREVDPVDDRDGGRPGGNIRVVFLFNPAQVSFVDRGPAGVDRSTTGTSVVKSKGSPALTLSPERIDPTNPVWDDSRKPLADEFSFRGRPMVVVANHFDSNGRRPERRRALPVAGAVVGCAALRPGARGDAASSRRSSTWTGRPTWWSSATSTTSSSARR